MKISGCTQLILFSFLMLISPHVNSTWNNDDPILIDVNWSTHDFVLHTIPSLQIVANPLVSRQFSSISKEIFANLAQLNAEFVRYAAWYPYPKMGVAELDPPSGLLQCYNVGENFSVYLSCRQSGGIINKVDFASYGTASGVCGQMRKGTCHASKSLDIIQQVCIGQEECSVPVTNDLFGDPCQ